jgi:hypothetical protein
MITEFLFLIVEEKRGGKSDKFEGDLENTYVVKSD